METTKLYNVTVNDRVEGRITHLNVTQEYIDKYIRPRASIVNQVQLPYSQEQYNKSVEGFYPDGVIDG